MPARDRTGPDGRGPQTGRGLGDCSGVPATRFWRRGTDGSTWFGRLFRRRKARNLPGGGRNRTNRRNDY